MDPKLLESVNRLVNELKKRIELLKSPDARVNLKADSYHSILNIINNYIHNVPSHLTVDDIIKFKIDDIEEILNLIALPEEEKHQILLMYKANISALQDASLKIDLQDSTLFFQNIIQKIIDYITEYEEISANQEELQSTKATEYKRYIDLFSSENFNNFFEDEEVEKLLKLMANFAIPLSDRQQILQYIALQNIKVPMHENPLYNVDYINLLYRVNSIVNKHLSVYFEKKEIIEKELDDIDIDVDIDSILSIAKKIAEKNDLEYGKTEKIIVAILLNSLLSIYTMALEQDEDDEYITYLKSKIENILNIEYEDEFNLIVEARAILSENQEFYINSLEMGVDINEYVDLSVSEIKNLGYDDETAIDYKTLPLIKAIKELLDKIEKMDPDSSNYNLHYDVLRQLIEFYHKLQDKKISKKGR